MAAASHSPSWAGSNPAECGNFILAIFTSFLTFLLVLRLLVLPFETRKHTTVRHGGMGPGISEASKRVPIFSFATQRPNGNWQGLGAKQACKVPIGGVAIPP